MLLMHDDSVWRWLKSLAHPLADGSCSVLQLLRNHVDEHGTVECQGSLDGFVKARRVLHTEGLDAEGFSYSCVVGPAEIYGEIAFVIARFLAGFDPPIHAI